MNFFNKEIYKDNYKFMFQRHIFCQEFINFFKELINKLEFPENFKYDMGYYTSEKNVISEEKERLIQLLLPLITKFSTQILPYYTDNGVK